MQNEQEISYSVRRAHSPRTNFVILERGNSSPRSIFSILERRKLLPRSASSIPVRRTTSPRPPQSLTHKPPNKKSQRSLFDSLHPIAKGIQWIFFLETHDQQCDPLSVSCVVLHNHSSHNALHPFLLRWLRWVSDSPPQLRK